MDRLRLVSVLLFVASFPYLAAVVFALRGGPLQAPTDPQALASLLVLLLGMYTIGCSRLFDCLDKYVAPIGAHSFVVILLGTMACTNNSLRTYYALDPSPHGPNDALHSLPYHILAALASLPIGAALFAVELHLLRIPRSRVPALNRFIGLLPDAMRMVGAMCVSCGETCHHDEHLERQTEAVERTERGEGGMEGAVRDESSGWLRVPPPYDVSCHSTDELLHWQEIEKASLLVARR